ncbi:NAD(P)H-dependent oxidoreductase subunit E [Kosmotoga pacifica]|uniref:NADH dehydrogenase n=1 Tax=Kosmotoga pacifica TaxID=1330330 RepID=A0A0G2ZD57_9BACT|nr:NAD(P)H-dependent oxidoreductase subunit E [Kosmotoga pacifica]AKI96748.1 hypothetical protein IX53_01705 [Kosmotoga pacifica]
MKVKICVGTMCHLMGSSEVLYMAHEIASKSKNIEIEACTCLDHCHLGKKPPIVEIDGKVYEEVTPEILKELLEAVK